MKSLDKLDFAYSCLKTINKITQTVDDASFYLLTEHLFTGLDNERVSLPIVQLWWYVQVAEATGHGINTEKLVDETDFDATATYEYDYEKDGFYTRPNGGFTAGHIKLLRLAKGHTPALLANVTGGTELAVDLCPMLNGFLGYNSSYECTYSWRNFWLRVRTRKKICERWKHSYYHGA
jgi:hypothetical protein